jgi:hypothetical protein
MNVGLRGGARTPARRTRLAYALIGSAAAHNDKKAGG